MLEAPSTLPTGPQGQDPSESAVRTPSTSVERTSCAKLDVTRIKEELWPRGTRLAVREDTWNLRAQIWAYLIMQLLSKHNYEMGMWLVWLSLCHCAYQWCRIVSKILLIFIQNPLTLNSVNVIWLFKRNVGSNPRYFKLVSNPCVFPSSYIICKRKQSKQQIFMIELGCKTVICNCNSFLTLQRTRRHFTCLGWRSGSPRLILMITIFGCSLSDCAYLVPCEIDHIPARSICPRLRSEALARMFHWLCHRLPNANHNISDCSGC